MRQYRFKPEEIGRNSWPAGQLRLEGIPETEDPENADLFVLPGNLAMFELDTRALERLPHIKGKEDRLVCFDCSDFDTVFTVRAAILIRCDLKRFMLEAHPNSIAWPWPVEDLADCMPVPEGGFKYDVSFHGWVSGDMRLRATAACTREPELKCDFKLHRDFYGYMGEGEAQTRRRQDFLCSLQESRAVLCPETINGILPYRFYEAMSAARVPILVGSNYNLPFSEEIPWDTFILRTEDPDHAGNLALYLKTFSDDELIHRGSLARSYWERWLHRDKWASLMSYAVQQKLASMGVTA